MKFCQQQVTQANDAQQQIQVIQRCNFFGSTRRPMEVSQAFFPTIRGGGEEKDSSFEEIFETHPKIDYSDNDAQARVIKHHYLNEFGKSVSMEEVLKDFTDDTVIHEVIDNVPLTFKGKDGARQAFEKVFALLPQETAHFEFEHIAVTQDHAQVVWKAETPSHSIIRGTDSFTFDKDNHIVVQTIVALSEGAANSKR